MKKYCLKNKYGNKFERLCIDKLILDDTIKKRGFKIDFKTLGLDPIFRFRQLQIICQYDYDNSSLDIYKTPEPQQGGINPERPLPPIPIEQPEQETQIMPEQTIVPEQETQVMPEQTTIPEQTIIPEQETQVTPEQTTIPEQETQVIPEQTIIPEQETSEKPLLPLTTEETGEQERPLLPLTTEQPEPETMVQMEEQKQPETRNISYLFIFGATVQLTNSGSPNDSRFSISLRLRNIEMYVDSDIVNNYVTTTETSKIITQINNRLPPLLRDLREIDNDIFSMFNIKIDNYIEKLYLTITSDKTPDNYPIISIPYRIAPTNITITITDI